MAQNRQCPEGKVWIIDDCYDVNSNMYKMALDYDNLLSNMKSFGIYTEEGKKKAQSDFWNKWGKLDFATSNKLLKYQNNIIMLNDIFSNVKRYQTVKPDPEKEKLNQRIGDIRTNNNIKDNSVILAQNQNKTQIKTSNVKPTVISQREPETESTRTRRYYNNKNAALRDGLWFNAQTGDISSSKESPGNGWIKPGQSEFAKTMGTFTGTTDQNAARFMAGTAEASFTDKDLWLAALTAGIGGAGILPKVLTNTGRVLRTTIPGTTRLIQGANAIRIPTSTTVGLNLAPSGLTIGDAIGLGFGIKGSLDLGKDIQTGYYSSSAPLLDKITRGVETGLNIGFSPGVSNAILQGYRTTRNVFRPSIFTNNSIQTASRQGIPINLSNRTSTGIPQFNVSNRTSTGMPTFNLNRTSGISGINSNTYPTGTVTLSELKNSSSPFYTLAAETGNNTINTVHSEIMNDILSPEGMRRLTDEIRLANPNLSEEQISHIISNRISEVATASQNNALSGFLQYGKGQPKTLSFNNKAFDETFPANNAYFYSHRVYDDANVIAPPKDLFPNYTDPLNQNLIQSNSGINLVKPSITNRFTDPTYRPGTITIGNYTNQDDIFKYYKSRPIAAHEIGHSFEGVSGVSPLGTDLRNMYLGNRDLVKKYLDALNNPYVDDQFNYLTTAGGRTLKNEGIPYIAELRQYMLDNKLINNRYEQITPDILEKTYLNAWGKGHSGVDYGTRLIEFTPSELYPQLSDFMNRSFLGATGAIGSGIGAGLLINNLNKNSENKY